LAAGARQAPVVAPAAGPAAAGARWCCLGAALQFLAQAMLSQQPVVAGRVERMLFKGHI
jgi:hypothetical protein